MNIIIMVTFIQHLQTFLFLSHFCVFNILKYLLQRFYTYVYHSIPLIPNYPFLSNPNPIYLHGGWTVHSFQLTLRQWSITYPNAFFLTMAQSKRHFRKEEPRKAEA